MDGEMQFMNEEKYGDIINLPHHVSTKHPKMSLDERSAQFAPFAALTGYEDAIEETARLTDERIDMDEEARQALDTKLQIICKQIESKPEIAVTYFIPDKKKEGGEYVTIRGRLKRVDKVRQVLVMDNSKEVDMSNILDIEAIV